MNLLSIFSKEKAPHTPMSGSQTENASAQTRLKSNGRLPINIWGDVMMDGSAPQIRRVVTGKDAHECLLSFFYLNEILTLGDAVKIISDQEKTLRPQSVTGRYEVLKKACPDPQHHLTQELLTVFAPSTLFFKEIGQENTELCELGCTFFSAIQKMKICSSLFDAGLDFTKIKCSAVDHSDFFLKGSRFFHKDDNVVSYLNHLDWKPSSQYPFHLSRFVASYAVNSTDEFLDWMDSFSAFHIIDVVNLKAEDFQTTNNGLKQIFFNFPKLMNAFDKAGWNVYLNEAAPDYNSGQKCAVVKIFGIRKEIDQKISFAEKLRQHKDLANILPMDLMTGSKASSMLQRLNEALTATEWEALVEYKKHFPIWGKPFPEIHTVSEAKKLVKKPLSNLNLRFEGGQINAYVRKELGEW